MLGALELFLRGKIGLRLALGQLLILGGLGEGQLGIAGMLLRQGLGIPDILLCGRQAAFELIAFLDCRLGNALVLREIEHQDDDNGDCRHEGRRESNQAGPLVVVGMQAAIGRTFIGRRRRVGVRVRRRIDGPPGRGRLLGHGALPCRGFAGAAAWKSLCGRPGAPDAPAGSVRCVRWGRGSRE